MKAKIHIAQREGRIGWQSATIIAIRKRFMQNMGNKIVSIFYNVESSLGRVIVIWDKKSFFLQFVKISDRQRHFFLQKPFMHII